MKKLFLKTSIIFCCLFFTLQNPIKAQAQEDTGAVDSSADAELNIDSAEEAQNYTPPEETEADEEPVIAEQAVKEENKPEAKKAEEVVKKEIQQNEQTIIEEKKVEDSPAQFSEQDLKNAPLVEIVKRQDVYSEYKKRRKVHGASIGFALENYQPSTYNSVIDGQKYSSVFDKTIPLIGFDLGYKFNFIAGSFVANLGYAAGNISSSKSGVSRTIDIAKPSAGFFYNIDNVFSEPYIVPYVGAKVWRLTIGESAPSVSASVRNDTGLGYNYTAGAMIQLKWLESLMTDEDNRDALINHGLQNAFIDIYATQYTKSIVNGDPDVSASSIMGAGLRLEF